MSVDKGVTGRIKQLVDGHNDKNVAQFATSIGLTRSSMSKIYRGEVNPSLSTIQAILSVYPDVDANWLLRSENQEKCPETYSKSASPNKKDTHYEEKSITDILKGQLEIKDEQMRELIKRIPIQKQT